MLVFSDRDKTLGAILAGGRATRFGTDKALALWDGRPLIDHVVSSLEIHTDGVVVCGREWASGESTPDRPTPNLGPLGGLNAALHYAQARSYNWVITAGCDTPLLSTEIFERLTSHDMSAIIADTPIIGRWRSDLAPLLDRHLHSSDDRSVKRFAKSVGVCFVSLDEAIPNINTVEDLRALGR